MFLKLNEIGSETTFELGVLTRAFVSGHAKKLTHFENIKKRVRQYKKTMYPENPVLTRLRNKVESLVERGRRYDQNFLQEAWAVVCEPSLPISIVEDPRFLELKPPEGAN